MFKEPFELKNPLKMHKNCEVCGQKFEPEPGFYFGAMFLSYIISGFGILVPGLILVFYFKWSVEATMALIIFVAILTAIKLMRFSRSLWIHFIVNYDKNFSVSKPKKLS
jgi:uncharacterized protein (DUF983 family)